jgi:tetratricopeptide (TPR) repeat protein
VDSVETVLKVANHFPDIKKSPGVLRSISVTLSEMGLAEDAIKYVNEALDMLQETPDNNPALPFYLTRSLSICHHELGRNEETVKGIEQAITLLPADWKNDEELVTNVQWIYEEKAEALRMLAKNDDAIQAYATIRTVRSEGELDSWLLDHMINILLEGTEDSNGAKSLALLRSWSENERMFWFDMMVENVDTWQMNKLNEMAAQNAHEGMDFLLECYTNYMATISPREDKMAYARAALASTYRIVIGDNDKAKDLYKKVLHHNLRDLEQRYMYDRVVYEVRRSLAEIILQEFLECADAAKKVTLLEEMNGISVPSSGSNDYFTLASSNVSIMVALMSRVVGQLTSYQTTLQKTFDNCIEGLSDTVGWNDSHSFRLLAKTLASVEGLEKDALIAMSCQFSKVTDEPEADDDETKGKIEEGDAGENTEVFSNEVALINSVEKPTDPEAVEIAINRTTEDSIKEAIQITETIISTSVMENGTEKLQGTTVIEEASVEAPSNVDPATKIEEGASNAAGEKNTTLKMVDGVTEEATPDPFADEPKIAANPDEELAFSGLTCDGECGRAWDKWEVPIHFCLLCSNTDLCPTCYGKRMAQNNGDQNTFWRQYCGHDHVYMKGPIKGWKGVKGGSWRIEGNDGVVEEKLVQEWLKELKGEKWPKAWDAFWKRLEGVKNIGF